MTKHSVDKIFLGITAVLIVLGLLVFISASLSVLAENQGQFYRLLINQLVLGLGGGIAMMILALKVDYAIWKKYALPIFGVAVLVTALVFVPKLGIEHGGAHRWLSLGPISFQPSEFLKLGFVIYFAAWLSWVKAKVTDMRYGLIPFGIMAVISGALLLLQPDTGTFLVMIFTGLAMFLIAGARWRDIGVIALVGLVGFVVLVASRPYLLERVKTFTNPNHDPLGSSYQSRQSLIAIGSGRIAGRGFGQSVQKFDYLPEPTHDAVFAIIGEEFGFIGTVLFVVLFIVFAFRGLRIASRAPNMFSRLLVVGIVILILAQAFMNIGSVLGLLPLTGVPLIFVSQGGSALLFALFGVGIILNVSRYTTK